MKHSCTRHSCPSLVSFIRDGKLIVVALDMVELIESHTGKYLAQCAFDVLSEFGIVERTLGHCGDNASNNDCMLDNLDKLYDKCAESIAGRSTQIRCFGHILNLVYHVHFFLGTLSLCILIPLIQAICNQFEPQKVDQPALVVDPNLADKNSDSADEWESDPEDDQLDDEEEETEIAAAIILEQEQEELSALWAKLARVPLDPPTFKEEDRLGRSAMQKIIKIGQRCARKGPLQKTLAHYCKLKNVPKLKMVKRVPTCWNTMYIVVNRARRLRKALDAMCNGAPQNSNPVRTKRLRRFALSSEEWDILEKLEPVLMVRWLFSSHYLY